MPEQAARLGVEPYSGQDPVKRADELDDEEMRNVVAEVYSQDSGEGLISGDRSYSPEQILEEVRAGSEFGVRMLDMHRREMGLLEKLFETGKITHLVNEPPKEEFPAFPF